MQSQSQPVLCTAAWLRVLLPPALKGAATANLGDGQPPSDVHYLPAHPPPLLRCRHPEAAVPRHAHHCPDSHRDPGSECHSRQPVHASRAAVSFSRCRKLDATLRHGSRTLQHGILQHGCALEQVCSDVKSILRIDGCEFFRSSINRPNLFYEVHGAR